MVSFGLTLNYRVELFSEIHDICFHGKGGFTPDIVYNMPIWWRRFTWKKLEAYYKEEKEAMEAQNNSLNLTKDKPKTLKPDINPTYTAKATKK